MRKLFAFGLFVALAAVTTAEEKKAEFDVAKLNGDWQITAGTKMGTKVEGDALKGVLKITKDKLTMGEGEMLFEFKYTIDTKVTPVAIDMEMTKSPFGAGAKAKGILSLEGDELKLCYAPDGDRPTKFEGEKAMLFVLKKKKD